MLKGFQLLGLLVLVTTLSSCSLFKTEPYCFLETDLGRYCAKDQETYESIEIEIGSEFILLAELVNDDRFNHMYTFINELFFVPKNSYVVYEGEYKYKKKNSDGIIEEYSKNFEIRKLHEQIEDERDISIVVKPKEYCMGSFGEYKSYYIYYENGTIASLRDLKFHYQDLSLNDYNINGFDCDTEVTIKDDVEYYTRFKNDETKIVVDIRNYLTSLPAFSSYIDDGKYYCGLNWTESETNYLNVGDNFIGIQDALDDELLEGEDLFFYSIPRCNTPVSIGLQLLRLPDLISRINYGHYQDLIITGDDTDRLPVSFETKTRTFELENRNIVIPEDVYKYKGVDLNGVTVSVEDALTNKKIDINEIWSDYKHYFISYNIDD